MMSEWAEILVSSAATLRTKPWGRMQDGEGCRMAHGSMLGSSELCGSVLWVTVGQERRILYSLLAIEAESVLT